MNKPFGEGESYTDMIVIDVDAAGEASKVSLGRKNYSGPVAAPGVTVDAAAMLDQVLAAAQATAKAYELPDDFNFTAE